MTMPEQAIQTNGRLAAVRRLYVYLVAFISLAVTLVGIGSLVDTLLSLWLNSDAGYSVTGFSRSIASSGGLLLVATPIFLIHWVLAQRHSDETDEQASPLRKAFLYSASAWSLFGIVGYAYQLIQSLAAIALGDPQGASFHSPAQWAAAVLLGGIYAALLAYWYAVLQSDGDFGAERTHARIVRQIFLVLVGIFGVVILLWGISSAVQLGLRLLVDRFSDVVGENWWRSTLAHVLTQLLVGGWLTYTVFTQWGAIVVRNPAEGQSALRRLYFYLAVVIGAVATLTPAALLLRELLLMLFGDSTGDLPTLLNRLISPISFMPAGLAIWLWHWQALRRETDSFGESRQGATVRRIYYYLMAATGLALLWVGSVEVLNTLIDTLFGVRLGSSSIWHEPLANGLSLLAVGAPIWLLHWRSVQQVAGQADAAGAVERDALPRKIYLYGVSLVAALILLFQLAQVIYRLLLVLMGDSSASFLSTETAHQLADCLIAGVFWGIHLLAIRSDGHMDKLTPRPTLAPPPEQSAEERRQALEQRQQALRAELQQIDQELALLPVGDKL